MGTTSWCWLVLLLRERRKIIEKDMWDRGAGISSLPGRPRDGVKGRYSPGTLVLQPGCCLLFAFSLFPSQHSGSHVAGDSSHRPPHRLLSLLIPPGAPFSPRPDCP